MNALLKKEIRLLLPAFAAAMVLAIVPVWLLPVDRLNPGMVPGILFFIGVMMLALSSFGREVGLKTLPFMLAQPLERSRIWRTKVAVLGVCIVLAFAAWLLSGGLDPAWEALPERFAFSVVSVAMYAAGGLWLTLLLRQVVASFWLTLLIPMAAVIPMQVMGASGSMTLAALGLYAVAAFCLARWQFLHLQDAPWTGGVVTLARKRAIAAGSSIRQRGPWAEMIRKELRLHEFTLAAIAGLFVLHLVDVALRKAGAHVFSSSTLATLEMLGVVWLFVPLLAGSESVAEERQLGTLDSLLCLPVSRRAQFGLKMACVLILGGLVSPALLCAAEWIGNLIGAGANLGIMGLTFKGIDVLPVFYVFLALSLVGFYASTLTRSMVQALAAGVVASLVFWMIFEIASAQPFYAFGLRLWLVMAIPTGTGTIFWLAYNNFRWLFESERRWRRNILGLTTVFVLVAGSAMAIYNRVWEWATPLEGEHGSARLPTDKQVSLCGFGFPWLAAILPDGRLWVDRTWEPAATLGRGYFAPGTNWADVALLAWEMVGIRSDGTLWVSEKPQDDHMVQFGNDTNWQSVAREWGSTVVLLKRDGTLWRWGTTNSINFDNYRGLRGFAPYQVGKDSDWARITRGSDCVYAWGRRGDAWALHLRDRFDEPGDVRMPSLDHIEFQSFSRWAPEVGLREDGTLWAHSDLWGLNSRGAGGRATRTDLVQIGADSDWTAVAGGGQLLTLKTDGSIWKWNLFRARWMTSPRQTTPERLGTHNDWVGVGVWRGDFVALAADGSLWRWPMPVGWGDNNSERWIAPSRKPAKIGNIFDTKE